VATVLHWWNPLFWLAVDNYVPNTIPATTKQLPIMTDLF
jgi:hypothetical protein